MSTPISEPARASLERMASALPEAVTCPVCGRTSVGAEMRAVEVEAGEYEEIDMGDDAMPGVGPCFARVVRFEWRCRRCRDGEPIAERVQ